MITFLPRRRGETPRNILVLRTAGLGDFILSVPAFVALRRRFPTSRVTLLTLHSTEPGQAAKVAAYSGGALNTPWVDLVRPHLIDDVVVLGSIKSASTLFSVARKLRRTRFDLAVNMIDVDLPWKRRLKKWLFIRALAGPVRQLGYRRARAIAAAQIPDRDPQLGHHVHGPLSFLCELDGPGAYSDADVTFDLRPDPAAVSWAERWTREHARSGPLLAIAPGAIHPHKNWPVENYLALTRELLARHPTAKVVILGTRGDRAKAEIIGQASAERVLSLAGQTSIAQSAALFARCDLVIGNDGGAVHLADAMGARVISLIPGIEFPNSVEPWNNRHHAIRQSVECAPCYSFQSCPLQHARCMSDIPISRVLQTSLELLDAGGRERPTSRPEPAASAPRSRPRKSRAATSGF